MTKYRDILTHIEAADDGLEDLPEATTDAEAVLRMDLANTLASALRIARALAADEQHETEEQ